MNDISVRTQGRPTEIGGTVGVRGNVAADDFFIASIGFIPDLGGKRHPIDFPQSVDAITSQLSVDYQRKQS